MNIVTGISVVLLAAMATAQDSGRDRFVGAWRLTRLEQPGAGGTLQQVDCTGIFVFTRDGHASVQVMERNPQVSTGKGNEPYSQGGYEASWGTYKVDERTHTFMFHIEGALVRALVGQDLPRSYEFSGSRLTIKSARPNERWQAVWERY